MQPDMSNPIVWTWFRVVRPPMEWVITKLFAVIYRVFGRST